MTLTRPIVIALSALALGVAGCGDDDEDGGAATTGTTTAEQAPSTDGDTTTAEPGAAASELEASADPGGDLSFEQKDLTAKAGRVHVTFTNDASTPHDFKIEKDGQEVGGTDVISKSTAETTVELQPGEYTFYCSVGSHRGAGMEGTLTVE